MRYKELKNMFKPAFRSGFRYLCLFMLLVTLSAGCFALKINKDDYAVINGRKIFLEIVATREKQSQGLMYIKQLPENSGMIFLFEKPEPRSFWMKNMEIPLDIIFLRNRKIINICKNVPPGNESKLYNSAYKSDCAIEVNAGFCDKYNVQAGDFILLSTSVRTVWGKIKVEK